MRKVISFISKEEHYEADAAVLACFDFRFHPALRAYIDFLGKVDLIVAAGGVKQLVAPEHESDREFILDEFLKSKKLHETKKFIPIGHIQCGAYGGVNEEKFYIDELGKSPDIIRKAIPDAKIVKAYIGWDGVYEEEA